MARKTASLGDQATKELSQTEAPQNPSNLGQNDPRPVPRTQIDVLQTLVHEYTTRDSEFSRLQRRNFRLGVITVLIIFAYTTLAALQWRAMLVANQNSEHALEVTERAYLNIGSPVWGLAEFSQIEANKPVKANIFLHNHGKTDADRIVTNGFIQFGNHSPNQKWSYPNCSAPKPRIGFKPGPSSPPIAPDTEQTRTVVSNYILTQSDIDQLGKSDVTVFGNIAYCDKFERSHCIFFCLRYKYANKVPSQRWDFCANGTEDYCAGGFGPPNAAD